MPLTTELQSLNMKVIGVNRMDASDAGLRRPIQRHLPIALPIQGNAYRRDVGLFAAHHSNTASLTGD
jgi:hypothetical protein